MLLKSLAAAIAAYGVAGKVVVDPASSERTTTPEDYWGKWVEYIKEEAMEFNNFVHHNERFAIFRDNIDKINRHNAQGLSWEMGITPFTHLTADEFKAQIVGGCTLKERDSAVEIPELDESNMADSVDWVAQGKVTAVKNQGQCGSCWAFSTTGCVESRYAIKTGQLNELSEQELVDCSGVDGNNGCNGGLMDYGFKYVVDEKGLCSEQAYAYVAKTKKLQCRGNRSKCGEREDPITGFTDVRSSESQLQAAVSSGPVSVAIEADQSSFQLYKRGVMTDRCGTKLDHGVLAVGYGTDEATGMAFWKVKNSWGAKWGENGYIRMCKDCGKNGNKGQCGIAGQPSFAVV